MHLNETKALKQKVEQQNSEIKKLQSKCTELEKTISTLQNSNEGLKAQLEEEEALVEILNNSSVTHESEVSLENVSFGSCEEENIEETTYDKRGSSKSYSYSSSIEETTYDKRGTKKPYSHSATQAQQKVRYIELPNQVSLKCEKTGLCTHKI